MSVTEDISFQPPGVKLSKINSRRKAPARPLVKTKRFTFSAPFFHFTWYDANSMNNEITSNRTDTADRETILRTVLFFVRLKEPWRNLKQHLFVPVPKHFGSMVASKFYLEILEVRSALRKKRDARSKFLGDKAKR